MHFKYSKKEKLCSKILIGKLFENSNRIRKYPLTLLWISDELPAEIPGVNDNKVEGTNEAAAPIPN